MPRTLLLVLVTLTALSLWWDARHPLPVTWDEANYVDLAYRDAQFLRHDGPLRLAKSLIFEDRQRPPGMRLAVLPLTIVFGPSVLLMRLVSIVFLWITTALMYATLRRLTTGLAATAATLLFLSCPVAMAAFVSFTTEFSMLAASALLFYALVRHWQDGTRGPWLGGALVLALAAGSLARVTFALTALPLLVVAFDRARRDRAALLWLGACCFVAAIVIGPWYAWNLGVAAGYAQYAMKYVRHGTGSTWEAVYSLLFSGIGAIAFVGILFSVMRRRLDDVQRAVAVATTASIVAVALSLVFSVNANVRYILPGVIPFAVLVALFEVRPLVLATCAVAQLGLMAFEPRTPFGRADLAGWRGVVNGCRLVFYPYEQWDWRPLYSPNIRTIAYLGDGHQLQPAALQFPWIERGEDVAIIQLWRFENGPIDWDRVMKDVARADLVLTVPGYRGDVFDRQELDNANNLELVQRLGKPSATMHVPDAEVVLYRKAIQPPRN